MDYRKCQTATATPPEAGDLPLPFSFLICTPLERFWPLSTWTKRNSITADVTYAFFVRIVLFPLIAYFEFAWLRQNLDEFLRAHALTPFSLTGIIPDLASWPAVVLRSTLPFSISPTTGDTGSPTGLAGGTAFTLSIMPKCR
jgi:hypothetical protein